MIAFRQNDGITGWIFLFEIDLANTHFLSASINYEYSYIGLRGRIELFVGGLLSPLSNLFFGEDLTLNLFNGESLQIC